MRLTIGLAACALYLGSLMPAQAGVLTGTVFVIDPGHGVRYPSGAPLNVGAVGSGGVPEAALALAVGERLATMLRADGARVVLTRTLRDPYRTATDRRKDNRARAALANSLGATAFLSLHFDGSENRARRGMSVFWWRDNSARLASAIRRQLVGLGLSQADFRRRNLAVTDEARVPAVLVELGFVSNPVEARHLATPDFQRAEARALRNAIVAVFGP